jgi:rfaE bifunctional protein kinase chain/domain
MLDVYWHGEVTRISPEAPVPIFSVKTVEERNGAAVNVVSNVDAMGVECSWRYGNRYKTIEKIRAISKGQHVFRLDFDHPQEAVKSLDFRGVEILILVDYGKGTLDNAQSLIKKAKKAGLKVLVDPKGYDYEKYRGADVIKPNLDEMKVMVGGWKDEADLAVKVEKIRKDADIGAVLLTRASDGMTLYTQNGAKHFPAEAKEVVDVTGAGETAIAALGVGLHRGLSLEDSVALANKAAGIKVGMFGPCPVVV